jgi:hypothetical protein
MTRRSTTNQLDGCTRAIADVFVYSDHRERYGRTHGAFTVRPAKAPHRPTCRRGKTGKLFLFGAAAPSDVQQFAQLQYSRDCDRAYRGENRRLDGCKDSPNQ